MSPGNISFPRSTAISFRGRPPSRTRSTTTHHARCTNDDTEQLLQPTSAHHSASGGRSGDQGAPPTSHHATRHSWCNPLLVFACGIPRSRHDHARRDWRAALGVLCSEISGNVSGNKPLLCWKVFLEIVHYPARNTCPGQASQRSHEKGQRALGLGERRR